MTVSIVPGGISDTSSGVGDISGRAADTTELSAIYHNVLRTLEGMSAIVSDESMTGPNVSPTVPRYPW